MYPTSSQACVTKCRGYQRHGIQYVVFKEPYHENGPNSGYKQTVIIRHYVAVLAVSRMIYQ
jgi:hypothetical protein